MLLRCGMLLGLLMCAASSLAWAGAAQPETAPSPLDSMDPNEALKQGKVDFFELYLHKSRKGQLKFDKQGNPIQDARSVSLCPACHLPLFKHDEPGFECVARGPRLPGPEERYAQPLQIKEVNVTCPSCKAGFVGAYHGNVNSRAGMDRDFCMHSVGEGYVVHSTMWMCPECGFAGPADKLNDQDKVVPLWGKELDGTPLRPETTRLVQERLRPYTFERMLDVAGLRKEAVQGDGPMAQQYRKFGEYIKQQQIPDWLKYKNALFLIEQPANKPPHTFKAQVYLEAAWACRRQVCAEIGITGLVPEFQTMVGKSIRLMNRYINTECLNIRQRRREGFVDPAKAETDPFVLAEACANIIKYGEQLVHEQEAKAKRGEQLPPQDQARFQVGDIFVLRLRQAGFLDRCGRIAEAAETLEKARSVIPLLDEVKERTGVNDVNVLKSIELNLQMLHRAVDERAECLRLEREYLWRSADELMQALFFNERAGKSDYVTSVYWAGELFRRDGRELEAARACFETTLRLIQKQNIEGKRARQEEMSKQRKDPTKPSDEELALMAEIVRLETLAGWSEEHIGLADRAVKDRAAAAVKAGLAAPPQQPVRENIAKALSEIEKRAGAEGLTVRANPPQPGKPAGETTAQKPPEVTKPPEGVKPPETPAVPPPPAVASVIKTRADLYGVYYRAITRFVKDKKANPESPRELVSAGYLKAEEACLDETGTLICPETQQKLLFAKSTPYGDAKLPYIFPRSKDPNQLKLFADGRTGQ